MKKVGPRHCGLVSARPRDEPIGQARIEPRMGRGRDAYKWIGGAHAPRGRLALGKRLKTIAQEAGVALVNFLEAGDCRRGGTLRSRCAQGPGRSEWGACRLR